MKIKPITPLRTFMVGRHGDIRICDCAHITLAPDEQVTFLTEQGGEYDVARKSWGFYATPSLNRRLPAHGLSPLLVRSRRDDVFFVFLLEDGCTQELAAYLEHDDLEIVCPLTQDVLQSIARSRP